MQILCVRYALLKSGEYVDKIWLFSDEVIRANPNP